MSYDQLAQAVDNLALSNNDLKENVLLVKTSTEQARDAAQAFAINAVAVAADLSAELIESETAADELVTARIDTLYQELADPLDAGKAAAKIANGWQVVPSVARARKLLKSSASKYAATTGYYKAGDGGAGFYYLDSTDTTSADNGGSVIVAEDGGRWKLNTPNTAEVKQFGAKFDGATDDTTAINAAADYAAALNPNTSGLLAGRIGAPLVFPAGKTRITAPIHIKQAGVRLMGQGEYATLIECAPGFVGEAAILFEHTQVEAVFTSSSVEELSLNTAGEACHGILYNHLYDHTDCINVKVSGVAVDKQAYYVRPRVGKTDPISQSLYMRGCTFYKIAAGTTPTVILSTLQEFNLVQVKIWNSHSSTVKGSSYPLELRGCRSGLLSQCSFLCTTAHGANITDNGRQVTSITFDTPLFENVTGGPIRAVSSNAALYPIANLQVRNPRYELPSGGEYYLDGCVRGYIEAGARNINMRPASVQNQVVLDTLAQLVAVNSANTYEAISRVAGGDHIFGVRLRIETSNSPRVSLKHTSSDDEYRPTWVYDGVTDNGFQLTKWAGGVAYPLYTQSGDMREHHFYDDLSRELLRLRSGTADGESSMFLLHNNGTTNTVKRVMVGAADSGGVGYRMLRVAN